MTDKRRLVFNTAANSVSQFAGMLSGLIFMPLLVRNFGMNDYGLYILAASIATYAAILDLGVGSAVVKRVAEYSAADDPEQAQQVAATALNFYVLVGAIVALAVGIIALNAGVIFQVDADGARLLRNLLLVVAVGSLFTWPMNVATAVLQGYQRYTTTAATGLMLTSLNLAVTAAVVVLDQGPLILMVATTGVSIFAGLRNSAVAARLLRMRRLPRPTQAQLELFTSMLAFSWPILAMQIIVLIVGAQTDRVIIGVFLGASSVALYEAAAKFPLLAGQVATMMSSAVMPTASQLQAEGREQALTTLFLRGSKYAIAAVTPIVLTLIIFAKPILNTWLGPEFAAQSLSAQILVSYLLLLVMGSVGFNMIIGLGKLKRRLPYLIFLVTLGNLTLSLALVKPLGILGVALGTAIPQLIDFPFNIRFMLKETGTPGKRFLREVVARTYPFLIGTLVVGLLLLQTPLMASFVGVAIACALAVTAYYLGFAMFGLNAVEREEIQSASSAVFRRFRGASR